VATVRKLLGGDPNKTRGLVQIKESSVLTFEVVATFLLAPEITAKF